MGADSSAGSSSQSDEQQVQVLTWQLVNKINLFSILQITVIGFHLCQAIRIAQLQEENQALRSQLAVLMSRLEVLEVRQPPAEASSSAAGEGKHSKAK
jgi:hypothetical protein